MLEMGITSASFINECLDQLERAGHIERSRFGIKLLGLKSANENLNSSRKLSVFLCHASQDKPVVRELYKRLLTEEWIDPWLDEEKLLPGQDWDLEIERAVDSSDTVIVFLSNGSITKEGYVQREIRKVLEISDEKPEGTIFVIPIRLDEVQIPRRLKMWQYVDFFPPSQKTLSFSRLIASLKRRAEKISTREDSDLFAENVKAILIRILDRNGVSLPDFYFVSESDITVEELLKNVKSEHPDKLPESVDKYTATLALSHNDFLNNVNNV